MGNSDKQDHWSETEEQASNLGEIYNWIYLGRRLRYVQLYSILSLVEKGKKGW